MSNKPLLGAVLLTFALQMATIYVPWLNPIFKTQPLAAWELGLCVALAALVFVAVELEKAWRRQRMRAGARPARWPACTPAWSFWPGWPWSSWAPSCC